jgi:integrase
MARKGDGIYKRGKSWRMDVWIHGARHQVTLGKGIARSVAVELASIERAKILKCEAGIGRKNKDISFDKAKEAFLAAAEAKNRAHTIRGYRQHLAELSGTFGAKMLSEISPFLIEKHKQTRIADDAPVGFNRELGTLRTLFNWCIDKGKFEGVNPAKKIKKIKESRGRERQLELEEEKKLLETCSEPLKTMLMCGIYAGLRIPSEVLSLKKADVDLRHGMLTIQGAFAKNGKTETVPLSPILQAALARVIAMDEGEYLFTKKDGQPYKTIQNIFRTACKNAGLTDVSPHVMRHTFASRLGEQGADIRTIQELGRWADIRMVQRYDNVSERRKREAIEKLAYPVAEEEKPADITNRINKPVRYTKDSVSA